MMWRALAAFAVLPGMAAGVIPALLTMAPRINGFQSQYFAICAALGALILASCVVTFYRRGRGTLAPWDPPKRLVVEDLYRFNRNPMYVGVVLILLGWAGLLGSGWHYIYAAAVALVFHLRVVSYEEPTMRRRFPEDWDDYQRHVPRWLISTRPYQSETESASNRSERG